MRSDLIGAMEEGDEMWEINGGREKNKEGKRGKEGEKGRGRRGEQVGGQREEEREKSVH